MTKNEMRDMVAKNCGLEADETVFFFKAADLVDDEMALEMLMNELLEVDG